MDMARLDAGGSWGYHQSIGGLQMLTMKIWILRGLNHLQGSGLLRNNLNYSDI